MANEDEANEDEANEDEDLYLPDPKDHARECLEWYLAMVESLREPTPDKRNGE